MHAVHWLRSRQEERELSYWLSIVAYDQHDRSFSNRIYLIYLIIFFGAWLFVTLAFFASGGAIFLELINPVDPGQAALFLQILSLGLWSVYGCWRALHRSPVVFSEQDEVLLCQTPVGRRMVTLRWLFMPWVKSGLAFWFLAVILGFSMAETFLPGPMSASRIPEYSLFGLRAVGVIIPIHLALYILQWIVGINRLQKDEDHNWSNWLIIPLTILFFILLLAGTIPPASNFSNLWSQIAAVLLSPFKAGLIPGNYGLSLLGCWLIVFIALGIMVWRSTDFSLSRAAQETHEISTLETAQRYGFSSYAKQLQDEKSLGVMQSPARLPSFAGPRALIWKCLLQTWRVFRFSSILGWVWIFLIMLGYPLLPDPGSRFLAICFWVIQMGQMSIRQIHNDLSHWSLFRQLPISGNDFLLFDLFPAYVLLFLISFSGLVVGSIIFNLPVNNLALLLPGLIAAIVCISAFDVFRQARSNLLILGTAPGVSAIGFLLGLIIAVIPLLPLVFLKGAIGSGLAILVSLGLAALAFSMAIRSYRSIGIR